MVTGSLATDSPLGFTGSVGGYSAATRYVQVPAASPAADGTMSAEVTTGASSSDSTGARRTSEVGPAPSSPPNKYTYPPIVAAPASVRTAGKSRVSRHG